MINRMLDPLRWGAEIDQDHICECFALIYLARYNGVAQTARAATALQRSYQLSGGATVPRVSGSTPAYTWARWDFGAMKRVTIAIEGTTTLGQLWSRTSGNAAARFTLGEGYCMGLFKEYAESIYAAIMLDDQFRLTFDAPDCDVTITGFSLGGGTAAVLAQMFKLHWPNKRVRLVTFGSPRVGDVHFANRVHQALHIYVEGDRVDLIPWITMGTVSSWTTPWQGVFIAYARNEQTMRFPLDGEHPMEALNDSLVGSNLAIAASLAPLTRLNCWYWHDYDVYRYMLSGFAVRWSSLYGARFLHMEYNDDNMWGPNFPNSAGSWTACKVLAGSPPPDYVIPEERPTQSGNTEQRLRVELDTPRPVDPVVIVPIETNVPGTARTVRPHGSWVPRRSRNLQSGTP